MAKYKVMTDREAMAYIEKKGLRNMTAYELRSVGRPLMAKVRRRMRNLREENLQLTPAYQGYKKENVRTSTNYTNKQKNQLLHEVYAAYNFLNAQTSTVYGAQRYMLNVEALFDVELTPKEARKMFKALDIIREKEAITFESFPSTQLASSVGFNANLDMSAEEIADEIIRAYKEEKERMEYEDAVRNEREEEDLGRDDFDEREFWTGDL